VEYPQYSYQVTGNAVDNDIILVGNKLAGTRDMTRTTKSRIIIFCSLTLTLILTVLLDQNSRYHIVIPDLFFFLFSRINEIAR